MSKNYEVTYLLRCVVLVEDADDEEQAYEFSQDAASFGDCEMVEGKAREITDASDLERTRRHADVVADDA